MKGFKIQRGVLMAYTGSDDHVVVPEGVEKIGRNAFANGSNVVSVCFPGTMKSIGAYAFSGCVKLSSIPRPEQLKAWPDNIFGDEYETICHSGRIHRIPKKDQKSEEDAYLDSCSYYDMSPYPLDPRARAIIQERNCQRYSKNK